MSETVELKLPPTGWQAALTPCSECLLTVEREANRLLFPGRQIDCYACNNRLTVVRTEKQARSMWDPSSYDEKLREWKLAGVVFLRAVHSERERNRWLEQQGLHQTLTSKANFGQDWVGYTRSNVKTNDEDSCVFATLGEGLIGLCVRE